MFTVLQDESTAEITFYMKGADTAMAAIVQYNDWLEEEVSVSARSVSRAGTGTTVISQALNSQTTHNRLPKIVSRFR